MILYFDTNIYDIVVERSEESALFRFLHANRLTIAVSSDILAETLRIGDDGEKRKRLYAISLLGRKYLHPPFDYLQTQELLMEARRCYPQWLVERPRLTDVDRFLRGQKRIWSTLHRTGTINLDLSQYTTFAERAIAIRNPEQKERRRLERDSTSVEVLPADPATQYLVEDQANSERFWRLGAMIVFWKALHGDPSMRDYRDWLLPFVHMNRISKTDWQFFWLRDVSAGAVPRNRIQGLADYYQTTFPITHGNAIDTNHATHLLDCDVFVTADEKFHGVLGKVVADIGGKIAVPFWLDRNATSVVDALGAALEGATGR